MYLTEAEYEEITDGETPPAYRATEYKMRMLVDTYTFGRLKDFDDIPEAVKMLMAELIDLTEAHKTPEVVSQSNDGVSRTFREQSQTYEEKCETLIRTYLDGVKTADGTPILYCGVS